MVVRRLEQGDGADVERARRELAAWFDAAGAGARGDSPATDWPAPDGCRWVRVPDRLPVAPAVRTPHGRAVLARVDDGVDLRLGEFDAVAAERFGGRRALRLRASEARSGALAALAGDGGGVLLFVAGDLARLAARAPAGLVDEVLLVGTDAESEGALLDRIGGRDAAR
ncbi:MAG: hypothetical protein ACF8XB_22755 [Planctomycetota bacterium JB042]